MNWDTRLIDIAADIPYPIGDGDHGSIKPASYTDNGVPYIRVADIDWNGVISRDKMVYIPSDINENNPKSQLFPNDIIISKTGATIGKVAIVPDWIPVANTTASIGKVTIDEHIADIKFVFWCMKSDRFQRQMWDVSIKSAQPGFNVKNLKEFKIPLPPLATQKKIAAILDAADSHRQKTKQLLAKYDELAQSIFLEMFGDPVTNLKKWEKCKLSQLCEFENGDRSSKYPSGDDIKKSGKLFLSSGDIKKGKFNVLDSKFISEEKYNSLKRGKCRRGDILMTLRGNGTGNSAVFDCQYEEGFINAQMVILRPNNLCQAEYLVFQLNCPPVFNNLIQLNSGSAQPQLSASSLKGFEVLVPPIDLQLQFTKEIRMIEAQKGKVVDGLKMAEDLFNSLLQKAFKGELVN